MKFKITKYNIQFDVADSDLAPFLECLLTELVPRKFKNLYFMGKEGRDYSELREIAHLGLKILDPVNNRETLLSKDRILHDEGVITLVPILEDLGTPQEKKKICSSIASRLANNA